MISFKQTRLPCPIIRSRALCGNTLRADRRPTAKRHNYLTYLAVFREAGNRTSKHTTTGGTGPASAAAGVTSDPNLTAGSWPPTGTHTSPHQRVIDTKEVGSYDFSRKRPLRGGQQSLLDSWLKPLRDKAHV